jgi:hypothetical protein
MLNVPLLSLVKPLLLPLLTLALLSRGRKGARELRLPKGKLKWPKICLCGDLAHLEDLKDELNVHTPHLLKALALGDLIEVGENKLEALFSQALWEKFWHKKV